MVENSWKALSKTLLHMAILKAELTHESSGVSDVGADLAVDLDEPLHADLLDLIPSQGILEAVPQEDDEGQALPQLVGTGGGTRSLEKKSMMLDQIKFNCWISYFWHDLNNDEMEEAKTSGKCTSCHNSSSFKLISSS